MDLVEAHEREVALVEITVFWIIIFVSDDVGPQLEQNMILKPQGPYKQEEGQTEKDLTDRSFLYKQWAHPKNWYKFQPLEQIRCVLISHWFWVLLRCSTDSDILYKTII